MAELQITIRVLTHSYVGGADPRRAEWLRIPTLRGLLRFWYRAKLGTSDTRRLFDLESDVFGSTRHGQGIRFIPCRAGTAQWKPPARGIGQKYLGYGAVDDRERTGLSPGVEYRFVAVGREDQLEELRSALRLLHLFGGVGARSRRGWGSIAVSTLAEPLFAPASGSSAHWFESQLEQVFSAPEDRPSDRSDLPGYPAFTRHTRVHLMEGEKTVDAVHQGFYEDYHKIAKERSLRDTEPASGSTPSTLAAPRVALGLPWQGKNSSGSMTYYTADYDDNGRTAKIQRRASPLFFKILKAPDGLYYGVLLYLKSRFLGRSNARLYVDRTLVGFPSDKAVDSLLKGLTSIRLP